VLTLNTNTTRDVLSDFGAAMKLLVADGKKVFVILSNPTSLRYEPRRTISRVTGFPRPTSFDEAEFLDLALPVTARIREVALQSGAKVIDPAAYLCTASRCSTSLKAGEPLYRDGEHMRPGYASEAATFIDQIYR
jgi:hypothetical protein